MPTVKRFGEHNVFTPEQLKKLEKYGETVKMVIPLEIDIYGDILIHHFWSPNMFETIHERYLSESFDIHNSKMHNDEPITIKCGNTFEEFVLAFDLNMNADAQELFSGILENIIKRTKTSHYPAIGIVEIPAGTSFADVKDVSSCSIIVNSDIKLTNIIFGFDNDENFFKHFSFAGYDQETVNKLPMVYKMPNLNHNMY